MKLDNSGIVRSTSASPQRGSIFKCLASLLVDMNQQEKEKKDNAPLD